MCRSLAGKLLLIPPAFVTKLSSDCTECNAGPKYFSYKLFKVLIAKRTGASRSCVKYAAVGRRPNIPGIVAETVRTVPPYIINPPIPSV